MIERILGIAKVVPLNNKSYRITLIKAVAELLEIQKGDSVAFIQDETGRIYIRKA